VGFLNPLATRTSKEIETSQMHPYLVQNIQQALRLQCEAIDGVFDLHRRVIVEMAKAASDVGGTSLRDKYVTRWASAEASVIHICHTVGTGRNVSVTNTSHGRHRQVRQCYKYVTRWASAEASVFHICHAVGTDRNVSVTNMSHGRH
jgi:hypothetical protein